MKSSRSAIGALPTIGVALAFGAALSACPGLQKGEPPAPAPVAASPAASSGAPKEIELSKEQLALADIKVGTVQSHVLGATVSASGRITFDAQRVAHVFSPVTGRVTKIQAQLGQRVKKGDVLASIVSPDMGQASSDLSKAEADVIAAEHDFKRKKELLESHAASAADVEASEDNYHRTLAEKERALQKVRLLHAGASLSQVAQGYPLTSPIDGEVIARAVNPGVEVQGQYGGGGQVNELFTIGELDSVWLLVDVFEMDLAKVHVGSTVSVTTVAFPGRKFDGKVDWISGGIDTTSRAAKVRCVLPNPDRALRPEMFATVNIDIGASELPSLARTGAMRMGNDMYIWVEKGTTADGKIRFEYTKVDADDSSGTPWIALRGGPAVGTRVIESGGIILLGML